MVASVPELTSRTCSTGTTRATISSASSTSPGDGVPYDVPREAAFCSASDAGASYGNVMPPSCRSGRWAARRLRGRSRRPRVELQDPPRPWEKSVKRITVLRALATAGIATTAVALAVPSTAAPTGPRFGAPVKVTPDLAGGYEPGIYADRFGNLYSTAHKENAELAISPDSRSETQTRSMSW